MSNEPRKIEFALHDKVDGMEMSPATISLPRFNEFNKQVEEFVAGSERPNLDHVHVSVEQGSYKLTVILPVLILGSLDPDLQRLQREDSLGEIDPKRAEVVAKWQTRSKGNPDLHYSIRPPGPKARTIELSHTTDYRVGEIVPWVKVEKYLFGTVMDLGGAHKANVHIRLDDSGEVVRVGTNQEYLKEQEKNHLYRKVLVRVEADQHFRTGQLRNLRLVAFEGYEPKYDESALNRFAEEGRRAWADVPDAAQWVRHLRGGT